MNKILIPTNSPSDWRYLLARPDKHWRKGYSAMSLAYCWEAAQGFPAAVRQVLNNQPKLKGLELLLAIPEYKVKLPGGIAASQNDLFVLARAPSGGLVAIMVEGKANEPFGPLVREWFVDPSPGKVKRLRYLCETLGLEEAQVQSTRYQLLHRTASAIIAARCFYAGMAMMLVHSFSKTGTWFEDYRQFAGLYDVEAQPDRIDGVGFCQGVELFLGWLTDAGEYGEDQDSADRGTIAGTAVAKKCECCGHHEIGVETADGRFASIRPGDQVQILED